MTFVSRKNNAVIMPKSKLKNCVTSEKNEEEESMKFIYRLNLQKKLLHRFVVKVRQENFEDDYTEQEFMLSGEPDDSICENQ